VIGWPDDIAGDVSTMGAVDLPVLPVTAAPGGQQDRHAAETSPLRYHIGHVSECAHEPIPQHYPDRRWCQRARECRLTFEFRPLPDLSGSGTVEISNHIHYITPRPIPVRAAAQRPTRRKALPRVGRSLSNPDAGSV